MNTAERTVPREAPIRLQPRDVITRLTDPLEYVVMAPVFGMPALYYIRRADGPIVIEAIVRRCEIATIRRPAPLVLADVPSPEAPPLKLASIPGLRWEIDMEGLRRSKCRRFVIAATRDRTQHIIPGAFQAVDANAQSDELRYSPDGTLDKVQEWCEERSQYHVSKRIDGSEELVNLADIPF